MMVDMGLYKIVHNYREPLHARIFNACIEDWELDILRTRYKYNEQRLLHKYKNIRLFDDENNQIYIIASKHLEFKKPTRRNKQYCVVGHTINWRDGYDLDLLISIGINDYFMVIIKGV